MTKNVDYQRSKMGYNKKYYVNSDDIIEQSCKQGYMIPIESDMIDNSILNIGVQGYCRLSDNLGHGQEGEGRAYRNSVDFEYFPLSVKNYKRVFSPSLIGIVSVLFFALQLL